VVLMCHKPHSLLEALLDRSLRIQLIAGESRVQLNVGYLRIPGFPLLAQNLRDLGDRSQN